MGSASVTSEIHRPADLEDAKLDADHEDLLHAANSVHIAREHACSNNFWKTVEIFFAPVTVEDLPFLKHQLDPTTKLNQTGSPMVTDVSPSLLQILLSSLLQILLSAIIVEDESTEYNPNQGISKTFASIDDDFLMGATEFQSKLDLEFQNYVLDGLSSSNTFCNDAQWRALSPDEKLSWELQSLGMSCKPVVDDEVLIDAEIRSLQEVHYQHVSSLSRLKLFPNFSWAANVKKILEKIVAPVQCELQSNKRSLEESAMDQLVQMSYKKVTGAAFLKNRKKKKVEKPSPDGSSSDALDIVRRTLARCRQFEASGKSCFRESHLQEIIFNTSPRKIVAEPASDLQVRKDAKQKGSSKPPSRSVRNKKHS